ncbi:ArsR family transcriptional regulator [Raineyella fluvialis]|uniref:ArsR family transcriptional regulator n=1 Tax=Raineyella fluvialis TaxID=2662261 RepID=A0A5Q2FDV7_9ACTN|nr:ArsR family transcriptional regulator [Raineyella fluvialis]
MDAVRPSGGATATAAERTPLPTPSVGEAERTTRERVVRSILEHGPSTAGQLAERLDLTPAAVRRHLAFLEEDGDLRSEEERVYGSRGRGRPAKVFLLTDAGRAHFPSSYDELAIQALRQLQAMAGDPAIERFAEDRVSDVVRRYQVILEEAASEGTAIAAPEALARALNDEGYVATMQPSRTGEQLCQHHCPVSHVAVAFPELCAAETEVFSRLLGVHVQRLATIADGNGVCTTHIPDAAVLTGRRHPRTDAPAPAVRTHSDAPAPAGRATTHATHQEG